MGSPDDGLKIIPSMMQGGCLFRLEGVLDHTLYANKLSGAAGGVIVIDLEGVHRVTSFGVREWIRALKATPHNYLAFVNAHPSVVSQFNIVVKFAAGGELLSLYAPYGCKGCGKEFEALIDVRECYQQLASFSVPPAKCPSCGGEGELDDVPSSYFAHVASARAPQPPPLVDLLLGGGNRLGTAFKVEKEVHGATTVLRFSGTLDASAHVKRVADGLDGKVVVRLDGVSSATVEGVERLAPLFKTPNVSFLLGRVPLEVGAVFAERVDLLGSAAVVSFALKLECGNCKASTTIALDAEHLDVLAAGGARPVPCDECGKPAAPVFDPKALASAAKLPRAKADPELLSETAQSARPSAERDIVTITKLRDSSRYQLVRRLGVGGMAEVFLAKQSGAAGFSKTVVVKQILPHLAADASFVEMFLQEAQVAARISHPNVVQILDLGEMAGTYFIAMEYVRGWDLNAVLRNAVQLKAAMPIELAAHVVANICAGLHAAHTCADENGQVTPIVHRDVSPHNVLVSVDGQVKLADFGIAKAIDSTNRTPTAAIKGKLAYMAPEQINSGSAPLDGRADLFAAGIILFQLVTSCHPFEAENEFLTLKAVMEAEIPPPSRLRPEVPPELDAIVTRALTRELEARYQTGQAFQRDLERFIAQRSGAGAPELAAWLQALVKQSDEAGMSLNVPLDPTMLSVLQR